MTSKSKKYNITETDREVFRSAVSDVNPITKNQKFLHEPKKIKPIATQKITDDQKIMSKLITLPPDTELSMESGEELSFRRNGINLQTTKKLRRGHWKIEGHLDLHGYNRFEAKELLVGFLSNCLKTGCRCIRIVHGKGLGSKNKEPILKRKIAGWLTQIDCVLAYCQAPPSDGGSGATLVLLKSSKSKF